MEGRINEAIDRCPSESIKNNTASTAILVNDVKGLYDCMVKINLDTALEKELKKTPIIHLKNHQSSKVAQAYLDVLHSCV